MVRLVRRRGSCSYETSKTWKNMELHSPTEHFLAAKFYYFLNCWKQLYPNDAEFILEVLFFHLVDAFFEIEEHGLVVVSRRLATNYAVLFVVAFPDELKLDLFFINTPVRLILVKMLNFWGCHYCLRSP